MFIVYYMILNDFSIKSGKYCFNFYRNEYKIIDLLKKDININNFNLKFLKQCSFCFSTTAIELQDNVYYSIRNILKKYEQENNFSIKFKQSIEEFKQIIENTKDLTRIGEIIKSGVDLTRIGKIIKSGVECKMIIVSSTLIEFKFFNENDSFEIIVELLQEKINLFRYDFYYSDILFYRVNKEDKFCFYNIDKYFYFVKTGKCKSSNEILKVESGIKENFYLNGSGEEYNSILDMEEESPFVEIDNIKINNLRIIKILSNLDISKYRIYFLLNNDKTYNIYFINNEKSLLLENVELNIKSQFQEKNNDLNVLELIDSRDFYQCLFENKCIIRVQESKIDINYFNNFLKAKNINNAIKDKILYSNIDNLYIIELKKTFK